MGWQDAPLADEGKQLPPAVNKAEPAWKSAPMVPSELAPRTSIPLRGIDALNQQARFAETTEQAATRSGVKMEGVGPGARFNLNLGLTGDETPETEIDIAKRAISRSLGVPVDTRIGPDTGEIEFRTEGSGQWGLVNAPGADWGDLGAMAPEAATIGAGVVGGGVGGVTGGAVGTAVNPGVGTAVGAVTGAIGGEAVGEGLALGTRLLEARRRGLIDMTDEQIFDAGLSRAQGAAIQAGVGGLSVAVFRRAWAGLKGSGPVKRAVGTEEAVRAGQDNVKGVQDEVQALTGQPFPVTPGQAMNNDALLAGERGAMQSEKTAPGIRKVREQQQTALEVMADNMSGSEADVARTGRDIQASIRQQERKALRPATERRNRARIAAEKAEREILSIGRDPATAVASMRTGIDEVREKVFAPFHEQFDELQQNDLVSIDLSGFAEQIKATVSREGQNILPSISLQSQNTLMREAGKAGENAVSLGEMQRALRDIRRELRRPGMADEPQRHRMLSKLKADLERTRDDALMEADPTGRMVTEVRQLEAAYRESIERFDRGVIGRYTETDRFGVPRMSGDDVAFRLLRDTEDVRAFIEATSRMPGGKGVMKDAQDAVLGLAERRALDDSGSINPGRLNIFLRTNRDSLEELFADRPGVLRSLRNVQSFKAEVAKHSRTMERTKQLFERRFGFASADPTVLVRNLVRDGNAGQFALAKRILESTRPDRVPAFREAVAAELRGMMGSGGQITVKSLDGFLNSRGRAIAEQALGPQYVANVRTWRNAMEIAGRKASPDAPKDIARLFERGVPALEGLSRVYRAMVFAPLSKAGRIFTASLGLTREQMRNRVAEALADPDKLAKLARLATHSTKSRTAEVIYGDLGLEALATLAANPDVFLSATPSDE